ncbi:MAG: hypothetical protein OXN89_11220 [Bryobacterales bacterium]|nr:hypothetical protein [Bryobacterales bacterium]
MHEKGFEEARRTLHEDGLWRSGTIYLVVEGVTPYSARFTIFV